MSRLFTLSLMGVLFGCVTSALCQSGTVGSLQSGAATTVRSMTVGELQRQYRVHLPRQQTNDSRLPIVLILHGGGGTSRSAAYEMQWDQKSDVEGFLAVYADAMPKIPGKPSHFATNPQLWNDGSNRFYQEQIQVDDIGYIRAVLDDILQRDHADPARIYVTGFSNGASMSFRVGVELSDRIAAIAPVAGALWMENFTLQRPVPMLYITGTDDPLNIIEGGVPKLAGGQYDPVRAKAKPPVIQSIHRWCQATGCPLEPVHVADRNGVRVQTYASGKGSVEVQYMTIADMGHTWPGGRSLLPPSMVGATSDKVKAVDVIWAFFQKHPMGSQ